MPCVSVKTRTCAYNMLFIKLVYFFVMQHTFNNKKWRGGGGSQEHGEKNVRMSRLMSDAYFFFLPLCLSLLGRGTRKWVWLGQFFIGSFTLLQRCWLLTWFAFIYNSQNKGCSSPCFSCICQQWFIQILMAVQYIHSKKVLHRCVHFLYNAFCQSLFMMLVVITHTS